MKHPPLRFGTRGSALARWQTDWVAQRLRETLEDRDVVIVPIRTTGDQFATARLAGLGTQGVFTRELQRALLEKQVDVAVHSLKDLPTEPIEGLMLAAVPPRGPVEDVLVLPAGADLAAAFQDDVLGVLLLLPPSARVGTGSIRRRAQLLRCRSDLKMMQVRGNVDTRLRKLDEGRYHALVLAHAGLVRLGLEQRVSWVIPTQTMLPAVAQGAIGVECRREDQETLLLLRRIDDPATHLAVLAERALLAALRGGCQAPVGALAELRDGRLALHAAVLSPDGALRIFASQAAPETFAALKSEPIDHPWSSRAEALGRRVAEELRRQGADTLILQARQHTSGED